MKRLAIILFMLVLVLVSCEPGTEARAKLEVSLRGVDAVRGLTNVDMKTESYSIVINNTVTGRLENYNIGKDSKVFEVIADCGETIVTVEALNSSGQVIGRGADGINIRKGVVNRSDVNIVLLEGNERLNVSIPTRDTSLSLKVEIYTPSGNSSAPILSSSFDLVSKNGSYDGEVQLVPGYYMIKVVDTANNRSLPVETVRIVKEHPVKYAPAIPDSWLGL